MEIIQKINEKNFFIDTTPLIYTHLGLLFSA